MLLFHKRANTLMRLFTFLVFLYFYILEYEQGKLWTSFVDLLAYIFFYNWHFNIPGNLNFKIRVNVINTMEQGTDKEQTNKQKNSLRNEFIYKLTILRNYTCLR